MKCLQQVEKGNGVENVLDALMKMSVLQRQDKVWGRRKEKEMLCQEKMWVFISHMFTNHPV